MVSSVYHTISLEHFSKLIAEAASYAASALVQTATEYERVALSEMERSPTELMKLAWKSDWYQKHRGGPPREIGKPSGSSTSTRAVKGSAIRMLPTKF